MTDQEKQKAHLLEDVTEYVSEDFSELNLPGNEFKRKDFEDCIFKDCDFTESTFSDCTFRDCRFLKCNLSVVNVNI